MGRSDTGWRLTALGVGWLAGVAWQLQQATLARSAPYVAALFVGVAALLVAGRTRSMHVRLGKGAAGLGAARLCTMLGGAALLGWGVTGAHADFLLRDRLPSALEGRDLLVTGVVATLPQLSASKLRFAFAVDEAWLDAGAVQVPRRLALGWYKGLHADAAALQPSRELRAGQRWRFTVRLRKPHGNLNPHGFDYELLLFEQGVRATGYVRDAPPLNECCGT